MSAQESPVSTHPSALISPWRAPSGAAASSGGKRIRWPLAVPLLVLLVLGSQLLVAALPSVEVAQTHGAKARLDQELARARTQLAIPESQLAPVTTGEQT